MWIQRSLSKRGEAAALWCFGHIKIMERERPVKKICRANVESKRERGRPRRRWMDGVQRLFE